MNEKIKQFVKNSVKELLDNTISDSKINRLIKKHQKKIHFIPIRYRVFGGLLQSMNIQFGNFLEKLLEKIIENEDGLEIKKNISGERKKKMLITRESEELIDKYITDSQNENFTEKELEYNFNLLIKKCLKNEKEIIDKGIEIVHDVDVLFSKDKKFFYLEVKYNDDHDTGKYADINRKFLKTYISLSNLIKKYSPDKFKPILYYITSKKLKGNIYIPEQENIYRGEKLFQEFFKNTKYKDIDEIMKNIGSDKDIIKIFDDLHKKIRYNVEI